MDERVIDLWDRIMAYADNNEPMPVVVWRTRR